MLSNYLKMCLSFSRAENKSYSLQVHNFLTSLPEECVTALESSGYSCEQMEILSQSSNAEKSSGNLLLEWAAQSGENLEGL